MPNPRSIQAELRAALLENQRLQEENRRLQEALASHPSFTSAVETEMTRPAACLPEPVAVAEIAGPADKTAKVALFRSLFRGREDVYAIRWRMKDGTWAYRPDDKKNWDALSASRPEDRRKVDRQTRILYSMTDEVIRLHLEGKKTVGI